MSAIQCPGCGKVLPLDAPKGLCPACLLSGALKWALPPGQPASSARLTAGNDLAQTKTRSFGDYEILAEIGQSAAAVVHRARQLSRNRLIALKVLRAGQLDSLAAIERFRQETEAVAKLSHPNIVPIYEVGEEDGQYFVSMKLVEGGNLSHHIACQSGSDSTFTEPPKKSRNADRRPPAVTNPGSAKRTPIPSAAASPRELRTAAKLLASMARAIHHAHERGIVHGNLKPSNILLDRNDHPYATDFGGRGHRSGFAYLAPQQAAGSGEPLSPGADIYSLGAILYEMLTGHPPFRADSEPELLRRMMEESPQPPGQLNLNINADLQTICLKCLEKQPEKRYSTAEAFASDLERWRAGKPISTPGVSLAERFRRWCQRKPGNPH